MEIENLFNEFKAQLDLVNYQEVNNLVDLIYDSYKNDRTIFIIGNGGSASNAAHLAQDMAKGAIYDQKVDKRIKALSLSDNISYITAVGNDDGFQHVFTSQLRTFAKEGDVLLTISCSGNSKNIIDAVEFAHSRNMKVVGVTGFDGGKLRQICDFPVHVPINDFGIVESVHSVIFHYLVIILRARIAGN